MGVCVNRLFMSNSLGPYGLQSARLLYLWDFPGKNTTQMEALSNCNSYIFSRQFLFCHYSFCHSNLLLAVEHLFSSEFLSWLQGIQRWCYIFLEACVREISDFQLFMRYIECWADLCIHLCFMLRMRSHEARLCQGEIALFLYLLMMFGFKFE